MGLNQSGQTLDTNFGEVVFGANRKCGSYKKFSNSRISFICIVYNIVILKKRQNYLYLASIKKKSKIGVFSFDSMQSMHENFS